MVKKYFQKTNLLLNKLLQLNKAVQNCTIVKLVGHNLVQHMCSIGKYRLIRPKHTPHVAPILVKIEQQLKPNVNVLWNQICYRNELLIFLMLG